MKLLIITPHLSTGGSPQYLLEYLVRHKNKYSQIKVIEFTNFSNDFIIQKNKIKNFLGEENVIYLGDFWANDETFYNDKQKIKDIIINYDPDIVWFNEFPECFEYRLPPENILKFIYNKRRTYKIIETTHNNSFDFNNKKYIPDEFLFCSDLHLQKSNNINIPKSVWEVPIEFVKNKPNRETTLKKLGLDPSYLHVLNVGIFNDNKNQKYIFDLASELIEHKIMFHFIGNTCFIENCKISNEQLKQNNCRIWGERGDVDIFMSCMDIFLFPSYKELNPLSVKEALSWRMNVICKYCENYTNKYINLDNFNILENLDIKRYLIDKINIIDKNSYNYNFYLETINIANESGSLGDTLAWVPVVDRYSKINNVKINFFSPYKELFLGQYENINFLDYQEKNKYDSKSIIKIGIFNDTEWKNIPLQKVASNILKIDHVDAKPKINFTDKSKNRFKNKYVCIATQSTSQCKYWNNDSGWNKLVKYLIFLGYDVVCIDKYSKYGIQSKMNEIPKNCIDDTGEKSLIDRIDVLKNCDFFVGLGSGLSWLAWACNKPVVMISGFSDPISEFYTPYRVHNKNVCNSCWNDQQIKFDKNNWMWCPRNKDFECSKEITFEMVKAKIDQCINDLNIYS